MTNTVVVYHSGYGHTKRLAQSVADGASASIVTIDSEGNLPEAAWSQLAAADAIIFGSPTYMGGPSWQFKKFADASSKAWFGQAWKDKFFGGFTTSASVNGDKHSTLTYMLTLASQHGGLWVSLGVPPSNSKSAQRNDPNYLGGTVGAMGQTPSDASVEEMALGDLQGARAYGARVSAIAARFADAA